MHDRTLPLEAFDETATNLYTHTHGTSVHIFQLCTYMYKHTCTYVCTYTCIYMYMYICLYAHIHSTCTDASTHVHILLYPVGNTVLGMYHTSAQHSADYKTRLPLYYQPQSQSIVPRESFMQRERERELCQEQRERVSVCVCLCTYRERVSFV